VSKVGVEELKKKVIEATLQQPYIGEKIPVSFFFFQFVLICFNQSTIDQK
jgi:hypothetical protein